MACATLRPQLCGARAAPRQRAARGAVARVWPPVRCSAAADDVALPRRQAALLLAGVYLAPPAFFARPAFAEEDALRTFYGAANPPATYGGVGGTTADKARYSFSVPASWTEAAVSKVDKGTAGIDTRFESSRRLKATITVVTLRNEGSRDGSGFVAADAESALKSVSGSDYKLQDALSAGTLTTGSRTAAGGNKEYTYDVSGPTGIAGALTTTADGRLFAIFVTAPGSAWGDAQNKALFQTIRDSFRTYEVR